MPFASLLGGWRVLHTPAGCVGGAWQADMSVQMPFACLGKTAPHIPSALACPWLQHDSSRCSQRHQAPNSIRQGTSSNGFRTCQDRVRFDRSTRLRRWRLRLGCCELHLGASLYCRCCARRAGLEVAAFLPLYVKRPLQISLSSNFLRARL